MTAPSQTPEAAGLEVVAWRWRFRTDGVWNYQEAQQRIPDVTCEPLVTAASAQARIVELEARVAELEAAKWEVKHVDTMNDMVAMGLARDDEKARADRLAQVVVDLKKAFGDPMTRRALGGHNETQQAAILAATEALQQETQP